MAAQKFLRRCTVLFGILALAALGPEPVRAGHGEADTAAWSAGPTVETPAADPSGGAVGSGETVLAGGPLDYIFGRERPTPRHIVIGLDLSLSNPMVMNDAFALAVANYVREEIRDLPLRSRVWLRTFGSDSATANPFRVNRTITKRVTSAEVGSLMRTLIRSVPRLVREGKVKAQNVTNIVSFLTNMAAVVDCDRYDTTIILATDGVEDSPVANLRRPGGTLPPPARRNMFKGCSKLLMLGVGQGRRNPMTTARLRAEWRKWAELAGFDEFAGLNNW